MGWRTAIRWIEHPTQFAAWRRHYSGNSADTGPPAFIKLQYYSESSSLPKHRISRGREFGPLVSEAPQWMQDKLFEVRKWLVKKKYSIALQRSLITPEESSNTLSLLHKMDYYRRAVVLLTLHHAFNDAVNLVNDLASQGIQPTTTMYVALMRSWEGHDPRYVQQILDRVLQAPPEEHSDRSVEMILAAALYLQYPLDQVFHFYDQYKAFRGPTWTVRGTTFGYIITAMMASGQHETAKQVLSEYQPARLAPPTKHGKEANPGILSIMAGHLENKTAHFFPQTTREARDAMFSRMLARPWPCREWRSGRGAQTYPYTAFAAALRASPSATLQDFDWICEQLLNHYYYPHVHLCNILIDAHIHYGEEKKAFVLYRAMMDSSVVQLPLPSPDTFHQLFTSCTDRTTLSVDTSHLHWAFHDMLCMHYFGTMKQLDEAHVSPKTLRAAFLLFISLRQYDTAMVVMGVMLDICDVSNDEDFFWTNLHADTIKALEKRALSEPTGWAERFVNTVLPESQLSALRMLSLSSTGAKHRYGPCPELTLLSNVMHRALQADLDHDVQWSPATDDPYTPRSVVPEATVAAISARRKRLIPVMWDERHEKIPRPDVRPEKPRDEARSPRVDVKMAPESSIEYSVLKPPPSSSST